jgi:2-oxoglutarate dehydrogenase E1 component
MYHLLRRQVKAAFRKPLIVFTPKSLLRHPKCVSGLNEFSKGNFQELIDDASADAKKIDKVVFCSGKLYYDLLEQKESSANSTTALVRIEQLYPFPQEQFDAVIKKYSKAKSIVWAQEEPENMGAWSYLLRTQRNVNFELISRSSSGSPATGSSKRHAIEQKKIIEQVFTS